uniref:SH3 domain-containing protein n=2 Tax=Anabas testudineus TaxID=64144 RepID=A0AAQ6ISW9_ANATE
MAFSHACKILWFTGSILVILPCFNLGLLSDYKICGDPECESLLSRVQATRDHHGKDCRFLNFRRGDTIFVYHKLTGKREDLWAGTIDRQFGYFPKDAVQEEQVYATTEKVVETQKSDFFCMDESGYPIDSSHLDNNEDDNDDDDDDKKIQNRESETTQTIVHADDTSAESPSTSTDPFTESPQQPGGTSTEEEENKNVGDTAATTHEETQETPAAPSEQGGSLSSSWLGSSVTGWLSLGREEQPGNVAEEEKKDEREEAQAEASLTSSVTGWLGFGGEERPDDAVSNGEEDKETTASFTSTMTGWLGFGEEKQTDSTKKEQHAERETDEESEPKETFRSRRMSLDLEGSQLQEEEKEMGTLDWLGNGLSSTLGFGVNKQKLEPVEEPKEKPVSTSWLDIGVGDILGFGKSTSEVDESTLSDFKDREKDAALEQTTALDNGDISQSQPTQTEEEKTEPDIQRLEEKVGVETIPEVGDNSISSSSSKDTNKSNVEQQSNDQFPQSETETATLAPEDDFNNNRDASDGSKGSILPVDAAARFDEKNSSPQTMFEEKSQDVGEMSSMIDEGKSAEDEAEEHQMHKSTGNEGEDNNREPGEEEIKTVSDNNEDLFTQSDTDLGSDIYSIDLKEQSVLNIMEGKNDQLQSGKGEGLEEARAKITYQVSNIEESSVASLESGADNDGHEHERSSSEADVLHTEIYTTLTDESAEQSQVSGNTEESRGKNQSSLMSGTTKEGLEPTHSEDDSVTADAVDLEIDPHDGEMVRNEDANTVESSSQEFETSHSANISTKSWDENASEDQTLTVTQDSTDHDSGSPKAKEVEVLNEEQKHEELEEVVEERKQEEDEIGEEKRQEGVYKLEKKEKQEDIKKLIEAERHDEKEEVKEEQKKEEIEELQKEEKQEEVGNRKGEKRQEETEEVKEKEYQEVKEFKEEVVQTVEVKEEEKQEGLSEVEKLREEEKHDEEEELMEEEKGVLVREVTEEAKQEKTKEVQVEEKQAKVEELKEEKQEEVQTLKEDGKQEELMEENSSKEKENEESEEKHVQAPDLEKQKKYTHDISKPESESSEEETHDENVKPEEEEREEEKTKRETVEKVEEKGEVVEMQQVNDGGGERREEEEKESLKCSNKDCHQATEDESERDTKENMSEEEPSSADKVPIQILADRTGASEKIPSEGTEINRLGEEQKEKTSNDYEADEREKSIMLNASGHEDIYGNNSNMSHHNGLEAEQIRANDQQPGHHGLPNEMDHRPETKEQDQVVNA